MAFPTVSYVPQFGYPGFNIKARASNFLVSNMHFFIAWLCILSENLYNGRWILGHLASRVDPDHESSIICFVIRSFTSPTMRCQVWLAWAPEHYFCICWPHDVFIIEIKSRSRWSWWEKLHQSLKHGILKFGDPSFSGFSARDENVVFALLTYLCKLGHGHHDFIPPSLVVPMPGLGPKRSKLINPNDLLTYY
jgi:hypothetical protein